MALGLGIGAMYVRSLRVCLVRQGTLDDCVHLEHGAHHAIGVLAMILLVKSGGDGLRELTASAPPPSQALCRNSTTEDPALRIGSAS